MSKIYVVTAGEYSDYGICAVFSMREQAEKYCACGHGEYVEEYELDAWSADGCEVVYRYHVQYPLCDAESVEAPRYLLKKDVEKDLQKIVGCGIRSIPNGPTYNRWDHVTAGADKSKHTIDEFTSLILNDIDAYKADYRHDYM